MSSATAASGHAQGSGGPNLLNGTPGAKFPGTASALVAVCSHPTTGGAGCAAGFLTEYAGRHLSDIEVSPDLVTWPGPRVPIFSGEVENVHHVSNSRHWRTDTSHAIALTLWGMIRAGAWKLAASWRKTNKPRRRRRPGNARES